MYFYLLNRFLNSIDIVNNNRNTKNKSTNTNPNDGHNNGKIKSIWTRKFKSGTHVFLNTTDHPKVDTFCIWWSDGSTTGNHCKPSTLEFVRRHDKSGIEAS